MGSGKLKTRRYKVRRGGRGWVVLAALGLIVLAGSYFLHPGEHRLSMAPAPTLTPGESIHVQQRLYHDFSVEEGTGAVLLGEVSQCNDDNTDNRFNPPAGRFPEIEEDEEPYRLLCNEYPAAK